MTPKELDEQSPVIIDKWVDVDSEECRDKDDNRDFTKKILRMGFEDPAFLFVDSLGRIWGKPTDPGTPAYPFHFEYGKKLIGYRISKRAVN